MPQLSGRTRVNTCSMTGSVPAGPVGARRAGAAFCVKVPKIQLSCPRGGWRIFSPRRPRREAPSIGADMTHKFRSGQTVHLSRSLTTRSTPDGDYKVVRQLPVDGGEPQYRIKSEREP